MSSGVSSAALDMCAGRNHVWLRRMRAIEQYCVLGWPLFMFDLVDCACVLIRREKSMLPEIYGFLLAGVAGVTQVCSP
jgi:hypothetical protein